LYFTKALGPFKLEVKLIRPFRAIFHDFLSEAEINWILEYSKPRLSKERSTTKSNLEGEKHEFREGKRVRVVHKTVQVILKLLLDWKLIFKGWIFQHLINMMMIM